MKYVLVFLSVLITACAIDTDMDIQTSERIARPAFMVERSINNEQFQLQAWERMHNRGQPATIYIEDDGTAIEFSENQIDTVLLKSISNKDQRLIDPTPENPVALHLASRDRSKNLAYLARPCQFIKFPESKGCDASYWKERRYTPEVVAAYQDALNDIAARFDINGFHLVGYGGGANIAAVLAAKRDDVLSLRTVAGNLSPAFVNEYHDGKMPYATNSLLATDFGEALSQVPQHHFIGAADQRIPPGSYHSYRQSIGLSDCISYSVVQDADHERGWVQLWPQLLGIIPQCGEVFDDLPPLPPAPEFPGDFRKTKGK
ncbi:MAG: alpha/beta hydrolase [Pseudomonadota bacterium]